MKKIMRELSAKDRAFEKEKVKYRQEINKLKQELEQKDNTVKKLTDNIDTLQQKIAEQEEWIARLLEYMDMSKEDLQKHLQKQKQNDEFLASMTNFFGVFRKYGISYVPASLTESKKDIV